MAHIRFTLSGPFPISYKKHPASNSKQISSEHAKLFWEDESARPFAESTAVIFSHCVAVKGIHLGMSEKHTSHCPLSRSRLTS